MSLLLLLNRRKPVIDWSFLGNIPTLATFTRTQDADGDTTAFDSSGVMQYYNANQPRFDHNPLTGTALGLVYEAQRTNYFTNSTVQGGTVGTSTFPTSFAVEGASGLTTTLEAKGTERGVPYMDIRVSGTPTATLYKFRSSSFSMGGLTAGAVVSASVFLKKAGGSTTNINSVTSGLFEASGSYPSTSIGAIDIDTNFLTRYSCTRTWTLTASAQWRLQISCTVGQPIDITIRVAGLQLELGAGASSLIPTSGAAVTRAQDSLQFTIPSSGVAKLRYTFDDDSTQDVTVSAGAYTVPTNLNRARIKRITSLRG